MEISEWRDTSLHTPRAALSPAPGAADDVKRTGRTHKCVSYM